jgi:hypothetical protein
VPTNESSASRRLNVNSVEHPARTSTISGVMTVHDIAETESWEMRMRVLLLNVPGLHGAAHQYM